MAKRPRTKRKTAFIKAKSNPTFDPTGFPLKDGEPMRAQSTVPGGADYDTEIVNILTTYKEEAKGARLVGLNPLDSKWEENLNLYWNRYDFSGKADWQAKEIMPEVPAFVDRWAAALKEALLASPESFYTVQYPYDPENDVTTAIKRMTDVWLSTVGRNPQGAPLAFPSVFEEQMKMGALMACASAVTWKNDVPGGRVAIEAVDPRSVWLDNTYRNLYRVREIELDYADLQGMVSQTDSRGSPIFRPDGMQMMIADSARQLATWREQMDGGNHTVTSSRNPVKIDEYLATVVDNEGKLVTEKGYYVVGNDKYLLRGPEKNPFWHNRDWLVYSPLVVAPLSVYGRSYMEDFGSLARTFNELTNAILDAVHTSVIKAFVMVPGMLRDPSQALDGIVPGKTYLLEDGYSAKEFAEALDVGTLDASAVNVWQTLKSSLAEAAGMNEIGLGQLPDKTHISASASEGAQQSSSAIIRSVAQTIETNYLNPTLDLVWKTGLQHADPKDMRLAQAAGVDLFGGLMARRKSIIQAPVSFQARGISTLIQKQQMLSALMNILGIIAQNENLTTAFLQQVDMQKLLNLLFNLANVDMTAFTMSKRQIMLNELMQKQEAAMGGQPGQAAPQPGQPQGQPGQAAPAQSPGAGQIAQILQRAGVAR
jgi:hypothetical protein